MPISRLLAISLFFSLCCAPAGAQLSRQDNAALDRIVVDGYQLQQLPHFFITPPEVASPLAATHEDRAEGICYTMRNYQVVRDDPHSDATHSGGYSTCQPAARFQVHSIEDRIALDAP
jgi:hypothetical protein